MCCGGVLAPAHAQQSEKVARVGMLCSLKCKGPGYDDFPAAMRRLGWIEGRNLEIDRRGAGGDAKQLARDAAELAARKPDLIFTIAPLASLAAKAATSSVPIVFTAVANPVGIGLVASLARPGGNVTGLASVPGNVMGKQFELLKEIVPGATSAVLVMNPDNPIHRNYVAESLPANEAALGLRIRVLEVRSADAIEPAIAAAVRERAAMLVQMGDAVLNEPPERIPQLALRARLPSAYLWRFQVRAGGLISYGPDLDYIFGRAAEYADRILRGARPADLPVEQPTKLHLAVNLKTARALGLKLPQAVVLRADEVIE